MTTSYNPPVFVPPKKKRIWPLLVGLGVLGVLAVIVLCAVVTNPGPGDSDRIVVVQSESTFKVSKKVAAPSKAAVPYIGEGEWLVGTDVASGTYRTPGADDDIIPMCTWVVWADDSKTEAGSSGISDKGNAPGRVVLKKGQVFETSGCKPWVKQ
jgi:hypothetical protein